MSQHIWSAQEGTLLVAALPIDHGLVLSGFLTFSPAEQFSVVRDVRGNVCRSRKNDPLCPVDLKLWNWSKHNQQLAALHAADTLSNKGVGLGIFTWLDNGGATKVASDACWVMQAPTDWSVGEEAFEVTWKLMIVCPPEFRIFGGN